MKKSKNLVERDEEDDTGDVDNASLDDTSAPTPKKKTRAKKDGRAKKVPLPELLCGHQ